MYCFCAMWAKSCPQSNSQEFSVKLCQIVTVPFCESQDIPGFWGQEVKAQGHNRFKWHWKILFCNLFPKVSYQTLSNLHRFLWQTPNDHNILRIWDQRSNLQQAQMTLKNTLQLYSKSFPANFIRSSQSLTMTDNKVLYILWIWGQRSRSQHGKHFSPA